MTEKSWQQEREAGGYNVSTVWLQCIYCQEAERDEKLVLTWLSPFIQPGTAIQSMGWCPSQFR